MSLYQCTVIIIDHHAGWTQFLGSIASEREKSGLVEKAILYHPTCILCSPLEVIPSEFYQGFWCQKTRIFRLLYGVA